MRFWLQVNLSHKGCLRLLTTQKGIMSDADVNYLTSEALKIFKWHAQSTVIRRLSKTETRAYLIADAICFPSAYINDLKPRAIHIELVQKR